MWAGQAGWGDIREHEIKPKGRTWRPGEFTQLRVRL